MYQVKIQAQIRTKDNSQKHQFSEKEICMKGVRGAELCKTFWCSSCFHLDRGGCEKNGHRFPLLGIIKLFYWSLHCNGELILLYIVMCQTNGGLWQLKCVTFSSLRELTYSQWSLQPFKVKTCILGQSCMSFKFVVLLFNTYMHFYLFSIENKY